MLKFGLFSIKLSMSNQMRLEKEQTKKENSQIKENRDPLTDNGKKKAKEERPATKVVVRRLPPSMTQELFVEQVSPLPATDYMYFVQADMSLTPHCFSRAYLNFVNQEDLFIFTQKFDNYVFIDSKGQEYPAVVEFAPFQRIPKHRPNRKKDPKMNTLESDPTFISFKEKLEAEMLENKSTANANKQHFFETSAVTAEKKEITTPLLDFIKNRRVERQRMRDEKREERRKKDLERRRAKDEQRKTKKDDDSPVVKPKDLKTNIPVEDVNLSKKSAPTTIDMLSASITDQKKPLSCDPNLPKGTPFSVASLQKCLLEFQNNILITSQLNRMNKMKMDLHNGNENGVNLSNSKNELELFYDIAIHSNPNSLLKPFLKKCDGVSIVKEDIQVDTNEIISPCVGSGDSTNSQLELQSNLMQVSILKNPLNFDTQCIKNTVHENIKQDEQVQIMKPLHRFAQKGVDKVKGLSDAEREKMYNKRLCNNLNKIVETVFKKTPAINNTSAGNGTDELKKTEFRSFSKVVRLNSPRPIKSSSKGLSSFTLNKKCVQSCAVSSSKSLEEKSDSALSIPSLFSSAPLEKRFENEGTVAKVWGRGVRTYPRRPHGHSGKSYFPITKKATA